MSSDPRVSVHELKPMKWGLGCGDAGSILILGVLKSQWVVTMMNQLKILKESRSMVRGREGPRCHAM